MRWQRLFVGLVAASLLPAVAPAQEASYKAEPLAEAPPATVPAEIRKLLDASGARVAAEDGKALADVWVAASVPASAAPAGPKGAVLFPVLKEGTLLGVIRFLGEGHDYRDQAIAPGVYTIRYGLQPVNGDHLGVSTNRDYALLVPAKQDADPAPLAQRRLESKSTEASGTNHPAVLMLLAPEGSPGEGPSLTHDEGRATWGLNLSLRLAVAGQEGTARLPVQLVVVGAAAN